MIQKAAVRRYIHSKGFRLSADGIVGLEDAIKMLLMRAMALTKPQKTIRPEEIFRALGKRESCPQVKS